jgi:hypothetical protein
LAYYHLHHHKSPKMGFTTGFVSRSLHPSSWRKSSSNRKQAILHRL